MIGGTGVQANCLLDGYLLLVVVAAFAVRRVIALTLPAISIENQLTVVSLFTVMFWTPSRIPARAASASCTSA
ncbi:hypothetical protein O7631_10440 [Micromonospora sp. WMMD967]|uniref:hypothetical protein n=1 Tax=Micromonospora sp. WMMD967 TaxID=3016101 RepID=UPI002415C374|nr:hypothetical protein [Micromonospora sp. WMMD967]MDG4836933.1 hypothetical protein [Micromonospora sp. WMMD967]